MKDERTKQFAYSFHAASDRKGFVLGTIVTPGNIHDSFILEPLVKQVSKTVGKPKAVIADATYKTPAITKYLFENEITLVLPYTRPRTKKGFFRKHEYVYDEYYDCYLCPSGEVLKYSTTNKEGYREYKSPKQICVNSPFLSQCTESKGSSKGGHSSYLAGVPRRSRPPKAYTRGQRDLFKAKGNHRASIRRCKRKAWHVLDKTSRA